jgi:TusA-related sulfurtransferase
MPIIKVRLKLNALKKGDELLVVADDPIFVTEFKRFCYLADLSIISSEKTPEYQAYHVKVTR